MSYSINFSDLMEQKPTLLDRMINSYGQEVAFYEHPFKGDEAPVIVVFPYEAKAYSSGFYDLEDMMKNEDYEPLYTQRGFIFKYQLY